jgi:mannose-6-phosphate isomerase
MISKPIFFEKNRVERVYTGGKLFDELFNDGSEDGFYPEEWIASAVRAINKNSRSEKEGISKPTDCDVYFDDLLRQHKNELLGPSGKMRILVKFLDSAIRLPAQAHPDKSFSKTFFNSEYGKAESWIILATRDNAKIFFGFKDGVDESTFKDAINKSEVDKDAMERLMLSVTPKAGDVFFVPAKTIHAIGAGCLILEIQEPTDFTIQPERFCGDYRLSDEEMYVGLSPQDAVKCFDFGNQPKPEVIPEKIFEHNGVYIESLINDKITPCFVVNRIKCVGGSYLINVKGSYAVYVVTSGTGELVGDNYRNKLQVGDYFFMPYQAMGKFQIKGTLETVECY